MKKIFSLVAFGIFLLLTSCGIDADSSGANTASAEAKAEASSIDEICERYSITLTEYGYTYQVDNVIDESVFAHDVTGGENTSEVQQFDIGTDVKYDAQDVVSYEELEKRISEDEREVLEYFVGSGSNVAEVWTQDNMVCQYTIDAKTDFQKLLITRYEFNKADRAAGTAEFSSRIIETKSEAILDLDVLSFLLEDGTTEKIVFCSNGFWTIDIR